MPTNILLNPPPHRVEIDGQPYDINADYRVFVRFELLMQDSSVSDSDKLDRSMDAFYCGHVPENVEAAVDEMLKIYTRGKEIKQTDGSTAKSGDKMIYSYEYDADMIYAAFRQYYGIDLSASIDLHWWAFKAMLDNLPSDCEFVKAMSYRSLKIDSKLPPKEQNRLRKLKEFYALPDNRTAGEKERDFANDLAALF